MKKYEVEILRPSAVYEIEAQDAQEAEQEALERYEHEHYGEAGALTEQEVSEFQNLKTVVKEV